MPNLPIVGSSYNVWGTELNNWLLFDHQTSGEHLTRRILLTGYQLDPAVKKGDVVYLDSSSILKQAFADGTEKQNAIGMVLSLDNTAITLVGHCDTTSLVVVGNVYYLSDSTAGRITTTPSSSIIKIGQAVTTDSIFVDIDKEVDFSIKIVNSTYTLAESDFAVICDSSNSAFPINLPPVANINKKFYNIKRVGNNLVTVTANGSELIDNSAITYVLANRENITIQSDPVGSGSFPPGWWII